MKWVRGKRAKRSWLLSLQEMKVDEKGPTIDLIEILCREDEYLPLDILKDGSP